MSLLVILPVLCASCGFHLRGSQPDAVSDLHSLYIHEEETTPVGDEIRNLLEVYGTSVVAESSVADYSLLMSGHNIEQTVLSVSAVTGKAEEYQLQLSIRITVTDKNGQEVISNQLVRITRDYAFDDTAVLGSVSERDVLINEMTNLAAAQIVRIINSLST